MIADAARAIRILDALAQENRLAILRLLSRHGESGLAAGAIADALDVPSSSLSFHLGQLNNVGLVRRQRRRRSLVYSTDGRMLEALIAYLLEQCCEKNMRARNKPVDRPAGAC